MTFMPETEISSETIVHIFNELFAGIHRTRLVGGADEPVYLPSKVHWNEIHFKEDFAASALHEVAHWCIAGARRRCLEDYGYWYEPDRGRKLQDRFQNVERRPQALEWIFSVAAGRYFRVSFDNLDSPPADGDPFRHAVRRSAHGYVTSGLPPRAHRFARALAKWRGAPEDFLNPDHYNQLPD